MEGCVQDKIATIGDCAFEYSRELKHVPVSMWNVRGIGHCAFFKTGVTAVRVRMELDYVEDGDWPSFPLECNIVRMEFHVRAIVLLCLLAESNVEGDARLGTDEGDISGTVESASSCGGRF